MYQDEEKKNRIEDIKKALYSRSADGIFAKRRHDLSEKYVDAETSWQSDEEPISSWRFPYKKVLLGAFIFFVIASGFAFFRFFVGTNLISGNNIDITIKGPVSIAGGEELPLDIEVKNKNNVDLKVVDLKIEYPDGTRAPGDLVNEMKRYSEVLGDINVGGSQKRVIKAVLFGEENVEKIIKITVEYRIPNSNAIFYKEKDYSVVLSSSPVNITVNGPDEVNSNQQVNFSIDINSNSLTIIKNLIFKIDYPFGFSFSSASPKPSISDGSVFNIGDLEPGAKRTINVSGTIQGQEGEQRIFKFTVGAPDQNDDRNVATPFAVYSKTVNLRKPFIGLAVSINGDSQSKNVAIVGGDTVHTNIFWQNNLSNQVYDVQVKVRLKGNILSKSSVKVEKGFYNSLENTITFDKENSPELASVDPGSDGTLNFLLSAFGSGTSIGSSFINPEIDMDFTVTGKRVEGNNVPEELLYSDSRTLKVSSSLGLLSRGFYNVGAFENSGPIPPKAEQETTYTITWTVTNNINDVKNAKVSATLPSYVTWLDLISPTSENITFNPTNREVIWDLQTVRAGSGFTSSAREISFHISFLPSVSQVGTEPVIVGGAVLTGTDSFSGADLMQPKPVITTDLRSDPYFKQDDGKVIQ